ncbi:ABC transporter permease, partial [Campylobacter jejuni]|nr:ABC transporter permease [Campylobacter jejuni]HEF7392421.1 ABC transporter permease [Campylobacter jejuni]
LGNLFYTWAKNSKTTYIIATLLILLGVSIVININNDENFFWQVIVFILFLGSLLYKGFKK